MSKRHTGTWKATPGKEEIRPPKPQRKEVTCAFCGRITGCKTYYMDQALGNTLAINCCGGTCYENYILRLYRSAK